MRRIVVCADDYGLAPGVSKAIRDLISRRRINATSVMTVFPDLAEEAAALAALPAPSPVQIGLHVTLTGVFMPLASPPVATADGRLPDLAALLPPLGRFRIATAAVEAEIEAQLQAFMRAFGRPPDFVDGHQHVQLLPGIRRPFLGAVAKLAPKAWVRQCGPWRKRTLLGANNKARFIAGLSLGFIRAAKRRGLHANPGFAGAYDFRSPQPFSANFAAFLRGLPDGGVVMCHPGFVDETLRARDPLLEQRESEYAFFSGEEYSATLERAGAALA